MRDLSAVLDHEEPLPPSGTRSSAVASQDHQRSVPMRRRNDIAPAKFEGHHEAALGAIVKAHIKEAAN